jgi:hypothetical protein
MQLQLAASSALGNKSLTLVLPNNEAILETKLSADPEYSSNISWKICNPKEYASLCLTRHILRQDHL